MNSFRPISISLSPNVEKDDLALTLKLIFRPWVWKNGSKIKELEEIFKGYTGLKYASSFNSGRSAFLAILKSLNLKEQNEVLLQAFTCNAAINPVLWARLKPVFVDCNEDDFNIDCEDLKRKITPKSKAVIVQHTFGCPADMDNVLEICKKNNLILIEDCAHALGAEYKGRKVGTFGKSAFFSFSRDKIISSVYGGMAVTDDKELAGKISEFQKTIDPPSSYWIFQQLLHPVLINYLILPTYRFFGKYLLMFFQWINLLSKAVHWKEKRGQKPDYFPKNLPNALAELADNQFRKLERFNNHRAEIAEFYFKNLNDSSFELPKSFDGRKNVFLRFTLKHPRAHQIIEKLWQNNILIGDWYTFPIAPGDTKLEKIGYDKGACKNAEKLAEITFNLPTHINISEVEAKKIVSYIKKVGF